MHLLKRRIRKIVQKERRITKREKEKIELLNKVNEIDAELEKDRDNLKLYKVQQYSDCELREDIYKSAVNEFNYPEEDLKNLIPYINKSEKWDNNIDEEILETVYKLDVYCEERKKEIGIIRRFGIFIMTLFESGGDKNEN